MVVVQTQSGHYDYLVFFERENNQAVTLFRYVVAMYRFHPLTFRNMTTMNAGIGLFYTNHPVVMLVVG